MDHVPQDHQIPADAPTHPATLDSGVQLPVISIEPGTGPSFELVASLVAERLFTIPITCYFGRGAIPCGPGPARAPPPPRVAEADHAPRQ